MSKPPTLPYLRYLPYPPYPPYPPAWPWVRRRRWLAWAAAGGVAAGSALLGGCSWLPRAPTTPMAQRLLPAGAQERPGGRRWLLVMLPGALSPIDEFETEGFVPALRRSRIDADVLLADCHLGYLRAGTAWQRLQADVLQPARQRGWQRIGLVGISLGGHVALSQAVGATPAGSAPAGALPEPARDPAVDGVLAIAPWLGDADWVQALEQAGGARPWLARPEPADAPPMQRHLRRLWAGLASPPPGSPPLHLGYGREDRLAASHRLMAGLLPPQRVDTVPGDHDWPAWRALWPRWLDAGGFDRA